MVIKAKFLYGCFSAWRTWSVNTWRKRTFTRAWHRWTTCMPNWRSCRSRWRGLWWDQHHHVICCFLSFKLNYTGHDCLKSQHSCVQHFFDDWTDCVIWLTWKGHWFLGVNVLESSWMWYNNGWRHPSLNNTGCGLTAAGDWNGEGVAALAREAPIRKSIYREIQRKGGRMEGKVLPWYTP